MSWTQPEQSIQGPDPFLTQLPPLHGEGRHLQGASPGLGEEIRHPGRLPSRDLKSHKPFSLWPVFPLPPLLLQYPQASPHFFSSLQNGHNISSWLQRQMVIGLIYGKVSFWKSAIFCEMLVANSQGMHLRMILSRDVVSKWEKEGKLPLCNGEWEKKLGTKSYLYRHPSSM